MSRDDRQLRRIVLVPGFCEPRWLLLPMRHALRRLAPTMEIWRDDLVFRSLECSVSRLRDEIAEDLAKGGKLAIVTHSFGDWVVRQAIAGLPQHHIDALVSVAPVIAPSPLARLLTAFGGGCISEVPVMSDAIRSAENSELDPAIRRLVIWASVDAWVRSIEFPSEKQVDVQRFRGTHLSVVLQPNVHRRVRDFLAMDELPAKGGRLGAALATSFPASTQPARATR